MMQIEGIGGIKKNPTAPSSLWNLIQQSTYRQLKLWCFST